MTTSERKKQALELYEWEPGATQHGASAGTRAPEGLKFQAEMRRLLARPGFVIETALGKSTGGSRLDGNASERTSFKMLRFKRNPLNREKTLVVALNVAFESYDNPQVGEIREQAAYLNGLDDRAPIIVLSRREHYKQYFNDIDESDEEDDDDE